MFARMVGLLCIASIATSVLAQSRTPATATAPASAPAAAVPAAAPSAGPTVGTVNGTEVYVRSAPSMVAYPCAKVSRPANVTVVGRQDDWYKILPIADTFSVVDNAMVQLDSGNQTGTIKQDTFARAGGVLRGNDFNALQVKIKAGEKVKITGEIGDYYRIVPPDGACLYINAKYVDLPGSPAVAAARTADASLNGLRTLETVTVTKKTTTTSAPALSAEALAQAKSLQDIEQKLIEAFKGPSDKIDVPGLLSEYHALKVTTPRMKEIVDYRIKSLQNLLDRRKNQQDTEALINETLKNQKSIDEEIAKLTIPGIAPELPVQPTAQGILVENPLFPGGATGPKRYTLRDPVFQRVDAYAQCTTGAVNLQEYLGKAIAVKGTAKFEPDLKLNVVEVQEVILLNDKFELPPLNKPTIIEPPAPPVKVAPAFKSEAAPKAETPKPADVSAAEPAKAEAPKVEPAEIILEPLPASEAAPSVTSKPLPALQD